jgi:hypothetical protein
MSASLLVLIPVVLFGLVTTLCFVGCFLDTSGIQVPSDFGPYENAINTTPKVVGCWPLNDMPPGVTAANIVNSSLNGTYKSAQGTFTLQQANIVPGDFQSGGPTPCASFNGGLVSVDFNDQLNDAPFTVEAWVKPAWTATDLAFRGVAASVNGTTTNGWALFATDQNFWAGTIAILSGTTPTFFTITSSKPIDLTTTSYLAMTYDGITLNLFVGTVGAGTLIVPAPPAMPNGKFLPVTQQSGPVPFFIAMSRGDQANGMFPFNGSIQDVAFYNDALGSPVLQSHFTLGAMPPG